MKICSVICGGFGNAAKVGLGDCADYADKKALYDFLGERPVFGQGAADY